MEATQSNNLSKRWEKKFETLEKAGMTNGERIFGMIPVGDRENPKKLTFKESTSHINMLAFLFGVFYYLQKGMKYKGSFLFTITVLFYTLLVACGIVFGFTLHRGLEIVLPGIAFSTLANIDYYHYIKNEEIMYAGVPKFFTTPLGAILSPLAAMVVFSALI